MRARVDLLQRRGEEDPEEQRKPRQHGAETDEEHDQETGAGALHLGRRRLRRRRSARRLRRIRPGQEQRAGSQERGAEPHDRRPGEVRSERACRERHDDDERWKSSRRGGSPCRDEDPRARAARRAAPGRCCERGPVQGRARPDPPGRARAHPGSRGGKPGPGARLRRARRGDIRASNRPALRRGPA